METELSFVIPCHNIMGFADRLKKTISGLTALGAPVVLVENNSKDETFQFLNDQFTDSQVIITSTNKKGAPPARNIGLQQVQTTYVKFLDADDVPLYHLVFEHLDFLKFRGADFSTSLHFIANGTNRLDVNFRPPFDDLIGQSILSGSIGVTSGAIFRREAIENTGGFSERLTSNQERDLYWRLFRNNAEYASFPCFTFIKYLNKAGISSTVSEDEKNANVSALNNQILTFLNKDDLQSG